MHLLLPYASVATSASATETCRTLDLPHLSALLRLLEAEPADSDSEFSLSPPHERAWARSQGWTVVDGLLPIAAASATSDGLAPAVGGPGWGLLSPTHWHVGADQVSLTDPAALDLGEADARALFGALQALFADDGWALHWGAPTRWYASHPGLTQLPSASLDRVIGRNVELWLNRHPLAQPIRRLQAEAQMLLYTHPVNAAREAAGRLPVNSFWLSGTGDWPGPTRPDSDPVQWERGLRAPALADDWPAWARAWQAVDAGPLAALLALARTGAPLRLTLCGERQSLSFHPARRPWWQRGWLAPRTDLPTLLATL